jgi:hypothetical protein
VLPKGFVRIRHFGFLVNRFRRARLHLCRDLLAASSEPPPPAHSEQSSATWRCPHCGAIMRVVRRLTPAEALRAQWAPLDSS